MATLIYPASRDSTEFIEDEEGNFAWGAPDERVRSFVNDVECPVGTYLYGRRMYEAMVALPNGVCAMHDVVTATKSHGWSSNHILGRDGSGRVNQQAAPVTINEIPPAGQ